MLLEPRLILLLAAVVTCLLLRGRGRRIAWLIAAAAATAALLPAFAVERGVPSPSAMLSNFAPWRIVEGERDAASAAVDRPAGNPELGDVTFQVEPWLLFLRHELREGRMPFWNPHQSSGAPFWSNGSSAPLFPLHLLFALLPLELGLLLLPWIRLVIASLGAYCLARELGIGAPGARLAGVIYPLSGRLMSFLLFPMANALCLVPWIFLFVERLAAGNPAGRTTGDAELRARRRNWAGLAVLAALQLLAGHPETAFFTAVACGIYLLARGAAPVLAVWGRVVSAWIVGLLAAGAALVPLAFTLLSTDRWQEWSGSERIDLVTLARLWFRFVLPDAWGDVSDGTYWGPFLDVPTSVYAGAVALPLAVAALVARERGGNVDRRLRGLAVMALVCLCASFHLPGFRELLLATPVVQKMLHHYLLLGVELGLALLAGAGLQSWIAGNRRGLRVGAVVPAIALVVGWAVLRDDWAARAELAEQIAATVIAAGLPLLLLVTLRLREAQRLALAAVVAVATLADLAWAHAPNNPGLPVERIYPPTPATEFLRARPQRFAAVGSALRPNAAMALGLHDVRGDDSLKLSRYERVYGGELASPHPTFFRPIESWGSSWLDRLGVRFVLAPADAAPLAPDWIVAFRDRGATVFERAGALPLVRFAGWAGTDAADPAHPSDTLVVTKRLPGRWEIECAAAASGSSPDARRLLIAETWDPGWSATFDGEPLALERVDEIFLGVTLPPDAGRLVVRYRPAGLGWGLAASGAGVALLVAGLIPRRSARERRRDDARAEPGRAAS